MKYYIYLLAVVFSFSACSKEPNTKIVKGDKAPQFVNYENHAGGTTSSTDLLGKYVYMDIWSTTCPNCAAQIIPHNNLFEKYKDKNIAFVSICIDKNKEKWRTTVTSNEQLGIQLIADDSWDSAFIKEAGFEYTPSYILIDKDGVIINVDAPWPSETDKIEEILDAL